MDRLKSGAVIDRRDALMDLAGKMVADERVACFAESHGARSLLLRGLDAAVKRGDEELIDAVSAAVAENSRAHAKEHKQVELKPVAGSQVGAAAQRPPGVEEVRLPGLGRTLRVHESSWGDAGLAWRIWGSAKITAHAIDAANSHHDDPGPGETEVHGQIGRRRRRRMPSSSGGRGAWTDRSPWGTRRGESRRVRGPSSPPRRRSPRRTARATARPPAATRHRPVTHHMGR